MSYAIMRLRKIKTKAQIASALSLAYRLEIKDNVDVSKLDKNIYLFSANAVCALKRLNELLPKKIRKNAVITLEYLMTASPEWFVAASEQQHQEFFKCALHWLAEKYGEHNIYAAVIHCDTTTPHLLAYVCPITIDGRLCCRDFLGGGRIQLKADQDTFAQAVKDLGLKRGNSRFVSRHTVAINEEGVAPNQGILKKAFNFLVKKGE